MRWNLMLFNILYETILLISELERKWYVPKFYTDRKRKKLKRQLYSLRMVELDRDFFIELIQFNSVAEIFDMIEGKAVTSISLSEDLEIRLYPEKCRRKEIINVKFNDRESNVRVNKDFKLSINKDRTTFNDIYVNIIINNIYKELTSNMEDFVMNKELI